jgi:hypothetical protein
LWNPYTSGEASVDLRVVSESEFKLVLYGTVLIDTIATIDVTQTRSGRVTLPARKCSQISLEYVDHAGNASISLQWSYIPFGSSLRMPAPVPIPSQFLYGAAATCNIAPSYLNRQLTGTGVCATYYRNPHLYGPVEQRVENGSFAFNWASGGPLPNTINTFSCVTRLVLPPNSLFYGLIAPQFSTFLVCGIKDAS